MNLESEVDNQYIFSIWLYALRNDANPDFLLVWEPLTIAAQKEQNIFQCAIVCSDFLWRFLSIHETRIKLCEQNSRWDQISEVRQLCYIFCPWFYSLECIIVGYRSSNIEHSVYTSSRRENDLHYADMWCKMPTKQSWFFPRSIHLCTLERRFITWLE